MREVHFHKLHITDIYETYHKENRKARIICMSDREISRYDRNSYITIHYENIRTCSSSQFKTCKRSKCSTFGEPYDYTSVMHYPMFACNNKTKDPTITAKNPIFNDALGSSDMATLGDARRVQLLYKCPGDYNVIIKTSDIKGVLIL